MHTPDFYMTSADLTGEWAKVRACWVERRVSGPYHSQYAVVRIAPAALSKDSTEPVHCVLISPKHEGTTLFPRSADPLTVFVYVGVQPGALDREQIRGEDVRVEAWCDLYSGLTAAENAAAQA